MEKIKIPYGESDFKILREENYIYVDKTMYIERLETYKKSIYVRPRRFGKSLFTSMISYYYDLNEKENFEKLYKGLYIYDHPTEKKNRYYILKFNFSGMNINSQKKADEIEAEFKGKVILGCKDFIGRYKLNIQIKDDLTAANTLANLLQDFKDMQKENKIYIIIDEYDHFTNGMLEGNVNGFITALGQGGFVRAFYEVIKEYAEGTNSVVDRFFATGIAPLTLDSLTSGFNIATNISTDEDFVAMNGFTEREVKTLIQKCGLEENVYEGLKKNYDGFRFSGSSDEHTFNVTLVMYYLRHYVEKGRPPENPIDGNLSTTGSKIEAIVNLVNPEANYKKLIELMTEGEVAGILVERFELNNAKFDTDSFLSMLFYNGYITIKDVGMRIRFSVPNYVSEVLYASYFTSLIDTKKMYKVDTQDIAIAIEDFGENGNLEPITKVVSNFLTYQSVRDKENFTEKTLKYVYSMFFSLSTQYYVYGEFPAKQGFSDIFIEKSSSSRAKYEAVIELKYLNAEKVKQASFEKLKIEALEQMKKYLEDKRLAERKNLKKYIVIFQGFDKFDIFEIE